MAIMPKLLRVTAIVSDKQIHDTLTYFAEQKAYNVEVHPVPPPAGLIAGPKEASPAPALAPAHASDAEAVKAFIGVKRQRDSASAQIREEIVKSLIESGEARTTDFFKRKGTSRHAVSNAVFFLTQRKLMKKFGHQHYKATPKLLAAAGNGAAS